MRVSHTALAARVTARLLANAQCEHACPVPVVACCDVPCLRGLLMCINNSSCSVHACDCLSVCLSADVMLLWLLCLRHHSHIHSRVVTGRRRSLMLMMQQQQQPGHNTQQPEKERVHVLLLCIDFTRVASTVAFVYAQSLRVTDVSVFHKRAARVYHNQQHDSVVHDNSVLRETSTHRLVEALTHQPWDIAKMTLCSSCVHALLPDCFYSLQHASKCCWWWHCAAPPPATCCSTTACWLLALLPLC